MRIVTGLAASGKTSMLLFSIVEFCGNVKRFFEKSFCGIFKAFSKMCARTHTGRVYAQKTCGGSGASLAQGRRLMVS